MVFEKDTDGKTAQVQNHQIEFTTSSPKSSGEAKPEKTSEGFLDLMIDTAFKFIFSKKQFMIPLLNAILQREDPIADIEYLPTEEVAEYKQGKKVVFDLSCRTNEGCIFIIEMQYQSHPYFRERAFYYLVRKIEKQLSRDEEEKDTNLTDEEKLQRKMERYKLNPIYGIYLTGFHLEKRRPRLLRDIVLADKLDEHQQFTDVFRMLFVELPAMKRQEDCTGRLEELAYVINNSKNLKEMPFADKDPLFKELEHEAREHCMPMELREAYEYERMNRYIYESQMADRFLKGREEGRAEGKAEGKAEGLAEGEAKKALETARKLKELGIDVSIISQATGLSPEEITQD